MTTGRPPRSTGRWGRRVWALLSATDPGFVRLRTAAVFVLCIGIAVGAAELMRRELAPRDPPNLPVLAGLVAFQACNAVREPTPARSRVTTMLLVVPAIASLVLSVVLAPHRPWDLVALVVVVAVAVGVRRFGSRGNAMGVLLINPYIFGQVSRPPLGQIGWLIAALSLGVVSALVVRRVMLPDRPNNALRRLVNDLQLRVRRLLDTVVDVLGEAAVTRTAPNRSLRALARAELRTAEAVRLVQDQLDKAGAGELWPELTTDQAMLRIVDIGLAVERMGATTVDLVRPDAVLASLEGDGPGRVDTGWAGTERAGRNVEHRVVPGAAVDGPVDVNDIDDIDDTDDTGALNALHLAGEGIGHALASLDLKAPVDADEADDLLADARAGVAGLAADTRPGRERVRQAALALSRLSDALTSPGGRDAPAPLADEAADEDDADDAAGADATPARTAGPLGRAGSGSAAGGGLSLVSRQTLQATVGAALAVVVGELVAPARWYWAGIAAFMVFVGVQSRGDVLSRGIARSVGTVVGVFAGTGLALVVGTNATVATVLIFVCLFLAVWCGTSQALVMFFASTVIVLAFGLLGALSPTLATVRVEETIAGSLAGLLAGLFVVPVSTRRAFDDAVTTVLDRLGAVLDASAGRIGGDAHGGPRPVELARQTDAAVVVLRNRTRTLASTTTSRRARRDDRRVAQALLVCASYTRGVARAAEVLRARTWAPTLRPAVDGLRGALDDLERALGRGRSGTPVGERRLAALLDRAEDTAADQPDPAARQEMLDVTRMLRRTGQVVVSLREQTGPRPRQLAASTSSASPSPVIPR